MDYLCQKETLEKLIDYSTKVPGEGDSLEAKFKYPFLAHKILSIGNTEIIRELFEGGLPKAEQESDDSDPHPPRDYSIMHRLMNFLD